MDSPRSGIRRAAVTSWALAGIGIAGVAGASTLAYGDTVKPAAELPAVEPVATDHVVDPPPPPPETDQPPAPLPAPAAPASSSPEPTPAPAPTETYTQTPTYTQAPAYTQKPAYTPKATVQEPAPAPAPSTKSQPAFPIRQSHVVPGGGGTSGGNSFSPHVTVSRGS